MDDLISRADAIEAVKKWYDHDGDICWREAISTSVDVLSALPSAEAVSRKTKCCPIAETCMSIDCPVSSEYIGRPSAEAVQGWIPCSERLPNEDGRYLVVYPLISWRNWISIKWFGKPNMPNRPIKGKCFYASDSEYGDVIWDNVIAWMPLPDPYREDGEA